MPGHRVDRGHKWATVKSVEQWPWAIVDEAYQMRSDLLLRVAGLFEKALFVGDPGQLDPFSVVEVDRWLGLSWDPTLSAVEVLLRHNDARPGQAAARVVAAAGVRGSRGVRGLLPVQRVHVRHVGAGPAAGLLARRPVREKCP